MRTKQILLATLGCLLLWTTAAAVAADHHEHSLKVGKKGEITLVRQTKAGDQMLKPGTYVVQHRVSGSDHFVRFVELKRANTRFHPYTERNAGETKCRVEPAAAPIKKTMVSIAHENGEDRITQVAIKGEDVVHVF
jgi:hypothetical protein